MALLVWEGAQEVAEDLMVVSGGWDEGVSSVSWSEIVGDEVSESVF